jgi:hypothetical protein
VKMNGQSRTFVKQVQVDLLALSDADLFSTIHRWVDGKNSSGMTLDVPEDTRFALGYIHEPVETETLPHLHYYEPGAESKGSGTWRAPSPHQLRTLLAAMDVNLFAQHVITLAFKSLHSIYPEWFDGLTFNAHLANYLRQMSTTRRTVTKINP